MSSTRIAALPASPCKRPNPSERRASPRGCRCSCAAPCAWLWRWKWGPSSCVCTCRCHRPRAWRGASVDTAARWSGSKAWRRPSSRPRPAGASRGPMSAVNLAYVPTFMPFVLSNPEPMERTCPGVATLRRDPDKATGGRAEDAEAADAALAASGDGSAFERLYRSHAARVHSLVRRMMGPETADDVTQDVFIRAWRKVATFRGEAAFGTWLHRLAVNVILARRTSLGLERGRFDDSAAALETAPSRPHAPDVAMDFDVAVSRLPDGARQVFVLRGVRGDAGRPAARRGPGARARRPAARGRPVAEDRGGDRSRDTGPRCRRRSGRAAP